MDNIRTGIPTSSKMWRVMSEGRTKGEPGAQFYSYLEEKRFERQLGRCLFSEHNAREAAWGQALEGFVYEKYLSTEYWLQSKKTIVHESKLFAGSPDVDDVKVGDIKCPWTLLQFMRLRENCLNGGVENFKKEHPDHFWQLVSNSILTKRDIAEIIGFCPKRSQLGDVDTVGTVRYHVDNIDDENPFKYKFIIDCQDKELPFIPDESPVDPIVRFEFEVKEEWKDQLITRVQLFTNKLNA